MEPMILTVTLNPSVDICYQMNTFNLGEVNRSKPPNKTSGGKGLNVTRVLASLGSQVTCTGFLGGENGKWIAANLGENRQIDQSFTYINDETRSCLAILSDTPSTQTEILEYGPTIRREDMDRFLNQYESLLDHANYIAASGSLPNGVPVQLYETLIKMAKDRDKLFLLDASGEPLAHGIKGRPYLIKPNKSELCELLGKSNLSFKEMVDASKEICANGVHYVLLSLGPEGAILSKKEKTLLAKVPKINPVNPVGSGDSMMAGFVYGLANNYSEEQSLRIACACGLSNAMERTTGFINKDMVLKSSRKIKITNL
jgi:tagatose 6-phosphate kinase